MRLLVVTQAVDSDDQALGFFIGWIREFAKYVEHIEIICLKVGKYELPGNVRVHALGTNPGVFRFGYIFRFYSLAYRLRDSYDSIFVHMNPEYVVLGGPLWRFWRKKIILWYSHRKVSLRLRMAVLFASVVATAAKESFHLLSKKVRVLGHGIDVAAFDAPPRPLHVPLRITSVGRITPIKNLDTLLTAAALLVDKGVDATVTLIGAPIDEKDREYERYLKKLVREKKISDRVFFMGKVPYECMPQKYREFDISINLCPTGGMDKAVLESMAAGLLVLASNQSFSDLFGINAPELFFPERDAAQCAERVVALINNVEASDRIRRQLKQAVQTMSVAALVPRILDLYETSQ